MKKTKELITKKRKNRGFVFEVDLEYPEELWGLHNDYPLAPEKLKIGNTEKLIGSFYPKKNYVIHYKNLKQYLNLGMKLTTVHGEIAFRESYWMRPYISNNTELRKKSENMTKASLN